MIAALAGLSLVDDVGPDPPGQRLHDLPIVEVAVLFFGIFVTMIPALELLRSRGGELGVREPWQFFWATGALSSFLDNAPTYLTFLALGQGLRLGDDVVGVPHSILAAISVGAVAMGANTYIGNAPNFMVKSIAEEAGVRMPSFFGYIVYSGLVLASRCSPASPSCSSREPRSAADPYSSSPYCSLSRLTTAGSASVVVSPSALPSAMSRRRRRMILPDRVLGRSAAQIRSSGRARAPIFLVTWALISSISSFVPLLPSLIVTKAAMACPLISWGRPMTAASATSGWSTSADSTSMVETRWPETFITSSTRPRSQKYPSSSSLAPSPVK